MNKTTCRGCGRHSFTTVLDLGDQPWCNDFLTKKQVGKENIYPLVLLWCNDCTLLQLSHTVSKETMFSDHTYLSGMTKTLKKHFNDIAAENIVQFGLAPGDLVVDIGGNDGTQLIEYRNHGMKNLLNVECAKTISQMSRDQGIPTITDYYNLDLAEKKIGHGAVRLYNASGVFFHLEELHSVIQGIKFSLAPDGVLVVQFMYAGAMVEGLNFDTIYHEHLCYYTLHSLQNLLAPYGLEVFDAYYSPIHSGSVIAKITHADGPLNVKSERYRETLEKDKKYTLQAFQEFARTVQNKRDGLRELLISLKAQGKTIFAYGAPAKGNTLLNYFGIDHTMVDKAVEVNGLKVGKYLPGSHIPVELESKEVRPDYYLLLSHNFATEILEKNKELRALGTKFIIPFPEVKVV